MINNNLKQFLDSYIKSGTRLKKITVFPLMCGAGKSTYLRYLISDALRDDFGLIIMTDRLSNLNSLTSSKEDKELNTFINDNKNRIAILNSDNAAEEYKTLHEKPVVLMTTQRWFNFGMDKIQELIQNRHKVVFDEKPSILETSIIDIKTLNDVDTAFKQCLNNTVEETLKNEIIDFWERLSIELQNKLKMNERENTTTNKEKFINPDDINIDRSELHKFNNNIYDHRGMLFKSGILKDIETVNKLLTDGGIVTSKKKSSKKSNDAYDNYFTVVLNNADKLTDTQANVFVLDGTADISPEYHLNCFNVLNCSEYNRQLKNLTIDLFNINTSKTYLTTKKDGYIEAIVNCINRYPERCNTLFTYQNIEPIIKKNFPDRFNVEHFGNIKGSNDFRNEKHISQIGLHILPHLIYQLYAAEIANYNYLHSERLDDGKCDLINPISDIDNVNNIMCHFILADIEQNLFRGCIRNETNEENMIYSLFCNYDYQTTLHVNSSLLNNVIDKQKLVKLIQDRYCKLSATVNLCGVPDEIKIFKTKTRNTQKETTAQRIIDWIAAFPYAVEFKRKDILNDLNITEKVFEKVRSKNEAVKALLLKYRIKPGTYKKQ